MFILADGLRTVPGQAAASRMAYNESGVVVGASLLAGGDPSALLSCRGREAADQGGATHLFEACGGERKASF